MQKRQKEFSSFKNRETVMESSLLIHKGFNGSLVNQTHADSLMELDTAELLLRMLDLLDYILYNI